MTDPSKALRLSMLGASSAPQPDRGAAQPEYIVGIGASAGALETFQAFFTHMPPNSGMAFVLVQHLDPQHPSLLPELLAPHTRMPVHSIVDRMPVAPDHVYLIPPNTTLTIDQGVLYLVTPTEGRSHRMPIDHFFQSLAADQGTHSIGIILEELQTSKEEIQSINEELQTVNVELNRKVAELDRVNSDLQNLFASTHIPAIFLRADGRIVRFTPAAAEVFHLIEGDIGRPIGDIASRFRDCDLTVPMREVLRTLTPYEEPVCRPESNTWWIMRIRPYRSIDNVIDGVVITFSDITQLKQAEAERERLLPAVQQARQLAERIVETVRQPLLILDASLAVQSANRAFYQAFHVTPADVERTSFYALGCGHWDSPELRAWLGAILTEHSALEEFEITRTFPSIGRKRMLLSARPIEQPLDRAPMILLAIDDITERAEATAVLQHAHDALETRVLERTRELAEANAALQAEISEHKLAEQARQQLLRRLVTAQEEERRRIARELHDQMGQDLTALMLGLKMLRDTAPGDSPIQERVASLQTLATQIGREVRTLALQLRPPALDDLGLAATLANYVEQWSARVLVAVDFHSIGMEERRLPSSIETVLYRVAQEALTNILKHAQATSVSLIVERRENTAHMIIEDDGMGFDVGAARRRAHTEQRLGLVGMEERVAQLGGTLTIETAPGHGTTVFVRIPVASEI